MKKQCLEHKKSFKKVLIMASGNGSNFEAIVKYFHNKGLSVEFELLCDKKDAYVLKRAQNLGIPFHCLEFENFFDFLNARKGECAKGGYDLCVLAGFMRILPEKILELFAAGGNSLINNSLINDTNLSDGIKYNIINIHPSLLPKYGGKNAIKRAFEANEDKTGVTVHFVNKDVDCGQIIEQKCIDTNDLSFDELEEKIHQIEHKLYPEIIENLLFKRNVLVFGGGAREHAIAAKISVSPFLNKLFLANPNDGFKNLGETIEYSDYPDLLKKARVKKIDMLVVGPENPLCEGIADIFTIGGIKVIGANKAWACLEGSKNFAKSFIQRNGIETADFKIAQNLDELDFALDYFIKKDIVPVIKADGLALGKGVSLPSSADEARVEAEEFLKGKFGEASKKIVLEERLFGKEVSVISLWDGKTLASFPPASDYKRLLDGNAGPNTGGMGAAAPSEISQIQKEEINEYLKILENALKKEKADFCGVIYSGLILTRDGVKVLEYNMRFGDPECQVLLELLDTNRGVDLLNIFIKMTEGRLKKNDLKFSKNKACCVVLASEGYPFNPKKGAKIKNLDEAEKYGCKVYFAGVKTVQDAGFVREKSQQNQYINIKTEQTADCKNTEPPKNSLTVNGGRVLSIVKSAENFDNTLDDIRKTAETIDFDGKIYRKDIGKNNGHK